MPTNVGVVIPIQTPPAAECHRRCVSENGWVTEPTIPDRADEDTDQAWGDEPTDENDERLEQDRPPHYDR